MVVGAGIGGVAAIGARIAAIEQRVQSLQASSTTGAAGTTGVAGLAGASLPAGTGAASATGTTFATALADQVAAQGLPAVGGLSSEQVGNAAAVVAAGRAKGLSLRDQAIGVMTALGESSLRVLDRGDVAGPDSRGLFQQRDNGAWGTYADRMDPTRSATSFFTALERVDGREAMTPTAVAHAVQRNADPQHYQRYWDEAVTLVSRLTGAPAASIRA